MFSSAKRCFPWISCSVNRKKNTRRFICINIFFVNCLDITSQNQQNDMWAQLRLRSVWASAQSDQSLLCALWVAKDLDYFRRTAKILARLARCPGWSKSSLGAQVILLYSFLLFCIDQTFLCILRPLWCNLLKYFSLYFLGGSIINAAESFIENKKKTWKYP